jgi:hypothetical protein
MAGVLTFRAVTSPNAVGAMPIIGQPVAYGVGFLVLVLVVFAESWAGSLVTVAHESGHMVFAVLTGMGHEGFGLDDGGGGGTRPAGPRRGIADWVTTFAGYPSPILLGLGGAAVIRHGNAWSVLWVALFLLVLAFFQAANPLANAVTLLAVLGLGWVAINGSFTLQVTLAVGVAWLLLIGGVYTPILRVSRGGSSDAGHLGKVTFIPAAAWDALFVGIGLAGLAVGGYLLLHH